VLGWLLLSLATLAVSGFVAWRCASLNQRVLAIISIALAGLLISPISWTHHWIWVLVIPPLLASGRSSDVPGPVRMLLWGLTVLAIAAPYWWFGRDAVRASPAPVFPGSPSPAPMVGWRACRPGNRDISWSCRGRPVWGTEG
jgi:hypothetical protein